MPSTSSRRQRRRSRHGAVVHELVARQADDPNRQAAHARRSSAASVIASSTAEPKPPAATLSSSVTTSFLPRALLEDQLAIERLGKSGVDDPDRPALRRPAARRLPARASTIGPKPTIRMSCALAQDLGLADGDRGRLDRRQVEAGVARVVQRERMVLAECRVHQPAQLLLVLGRGDDDVGQLALSGDREHALVARAVLAHETGAIDADDDRRVVLAHVVDGLVERALQERGVERHERPHSAEGKPGGERHRVLLGDADVEHARRETRPRTWRGPCRWACPR